jgi:hypothetical protein
MKILFIGPTYFPEGQAYSSRMLNICKMLRKNHEVKVLAFYNLENLKKGIIDDVNFEILFDNQNKVSFFKQYFLIKNWLKKNTEFDVIIYSASMFKFFDLIINYVKKNKMKSILEICENYSHNSFNGGIFNPFYWYFKFLYFFRFFKPNGTIAISSF